MLFGYCSLTNFWDQFLVLLLWILIDVTSIEAKLRKCVSWSYQSFPILLCLHVIQILLFIKFLELASGSFAINPDWCDFHRMQNWEGVVLGVIEAFPVWIILLVSCVCMLLKCCSLTNSWNQFLVLCLLLILHCNWYDFHRMQSWGDVLLPRGHRSFPTLD